MKRAVCVFVRNADGLILAVPRRGTNDQFGLPGGKVDPDDVSDVAAACRELREETGLSIGPESLTLLYECVVPPGPDGKSFLTKTYFFASVTDLSGDVDAPVGDCGQAGWVSEETLFSGPFGDYNRQVVAAEKAFLQNGRLATKD